VNQGATACIASSAFRSARARPRGRRVRIGFQRRVKRPVSVDVFQVSQGRRVLRERLIARFRKRSRSFTWNGRANVRGRRARDGHYFVRYRMRIAGRHAEFRRVVLVRRNGRYHRRPDYYRRATCDPLVSYKLRRPVFGGTARTRLGISARLSRAATVRVSVLRGKKVVRRYKARRLRAGRTHRLRFAAASRPRGDYRVRIVVRRGARTIRAALVSRKI
jgi:hypothetical protein